MNLYIYGMSFMHVCMFSWVSFVTVVIYGLWRRAVKICSRLQEHPLSGNQTLQTHRHCGNLHWMFYQRHQCEDQLSSLHPPPQLRHKDGPTGVQLPCCRAPALTRKYWLQRRHDGWSNNCWWVYQLRGWEKSTRRRYHVIKIGHRFVGIQSVIHYYPCIFTYWIILFLYTGFQRNDNVCNKSDNALKRVTCHAVTDPTSTS